MSRDFSNIDWLLYSHMYSIGCFDWFINLPFSPAFDNCFISFVLLLDIASRYTSQYHHVDVLMFVSVKGTFNYRFNTKCPKFRTFLPPCLHFFDFCNPMPLPTKVQNFTSTVVVSRFIWRTFIWSKPNLNPHSRNTLFNHLFLLKKNSLQFYPPWSESYKTQWAKSGNTRQKVGNKGHIVNH